MRWQKEICGIAPAGDIGDWFRLELAASQPTGDVVRGVRVPVKAYIGIAPWAQFHVDLVGSDLRMTGQPDDVPPLAPLAMPGIVQHGYRAYPLVDHVADKVAATYQRYGGQAKPSTRYRDLVDLVAIVIGAEIAAQPQRAALDSEFKRRGITFPTRFAIPDRSLWATGYAAAAAESLLPIARTLDEALAIVGPFPRSPPRRNRCRHLGSAARRMESLKPTPSKLSAIASACRAAYCQRGRGRSAPGWRTEVPMAHTGIDTELPTTASGSGAVSRNPA